MLSRDLMLALLNVPEDAHVAPGQVLENYLRTEIDSAGYADDAERGEALSERLHAYLRADAGIYLDRDGAKLDYYIKF